MTRRAPAATIERADCARREARSRARDARNLEIEAQKIATNRARARLTAPRLRGDRAGREPHEACNMRAGGV